MSTITLLGNQASHTAGGKSKDFEKKKYEIACGGYILAHPLKKRTKKKDKDKQDMALLSHDH
eukprot:scaffold55262_cov38-Attheya_sp.AAC.1